MAYEAAAPTRASGRLLRASHLRKQAPLATNQLLGVLSRISYYYFQLSVQALVVSLWLCLWFSQAPGLFSNPAQQQPNAEVATTTAHCQPLDVSNVLAGGVPGIAGQLGGTERNGSVYLNTSCYVLNTYAQGPFPLQGTLLVTTQTSDPTTFWCAGAHMGSRVSGGSGLRCSFVDFLLPTPYTHTHQVWLSIPAGAHHSR